jgi:hypothetical protein
MEGYMRKTCFVSILLLFFIIMICISSYAEESITVSCYVGDLSDNEEVGEIEVLKTATATRDCNKIYKEDCKGQCTGCYTSEDSGEICIDKKGKEFPKE